MDAELEGETSEECARFGAVERCLIYALPDAAAPPDEAVRIFVKFRQPDAAARAVAALNGRFFAGRQVRATLYDEALFRSHYFTAPATVSEG